MGTESFSINTVVQKTDHTDQGRLTRTGLLHLGASFRYYK